MRDNSHTHRSLDPGSDEPVRDSDMGGARQGELELVQAQGVHAQDQALALFVSLERLAGVDVERRRQEKSESGHLNVLRSDEEQSFLHLPSQEALDVGMDVRMGVVMIVVGGENYDRCSWIQILLAR